MGLFLWWFIHAYPHGTPKLSSHPSSPNPLRNVDPGHPTTFGHSLRDILRHHCRLPAVPAEVDAAEDIQENALFEQKKPSKTKANHLSSYISYTQSSAKSTLLWGEHLSLAWFLVAWSPSSLLQKLRGSLGDQGFAHLVLIQLFLAKGR